MLFQRHSFVQVILYMWGHMTKCTCHVIETHLTNIFVCIFLREGSLSLIVSKQPQTRGSVEVVVGDVKVIGTSTQNADLFLFSGWSHILRWQHSLWPEIAL